jgi:hypothetical protein
MALKGNRKYDEGTEILYVMNEAAEAGIIVVAGSSGTGMPGDANNVAQVPTTVSGLPVGLLVTDVVSIDLSRHAHLARNHRDEVPIGSPVTLVRDGWVVTDRLQSGVSPTPGQTAYFNSSGFFTNVAGSASVGQFLGQPTSDGYVRVDITLGS